MKMVGFGGVCVAFVVDCLNLDAPDSMIYMMPVLFTKSG